MYKEEIKDFIGFAIMVVALTALVGSLIYIFRPIHTTCVLEEPHGRAYYDCVKE